MKAAYLLRQGGPDVLRYGELPDPQPGMGQVAVDVFAASINGADWKVRSGLYRELDAFPYILGRDFSGVVSAIGPGVSALNIGDEVFGVLPVGQEGTYAEKVVVDAAILAAKPSNLPHSMAAAIALAGLTAIDAIEKCLKLERSESIFISGGAGGVAGLAIQIARRKGATIATTTSRAHIDYVRSLGATTVIDYARDDICKLGRVFDCALDTVGADVACSCFRIVKPGGRVAFIASGAEAPASPDPSVRALRPTVERDKLSLERIANLVLSGAIQAPDLLTYRLRDAARAHRVSEGRHFAGKLVLQVRDVRRPRPRIRLLS